MKTWLKPVLSVVGVLILFFIIKFTAHASKMVMDNNFGRSPIWWFVIAAAGGALFLAANPIEKFILKQFEEKPLSPEEEREEIEKILRERKKAREKQEAKIIKSILREREEAEARKNIADKTQELKNLSNEELKERLNGLNRR